MNPEFWHSRWREGRIGFHKSAINPLLVEYFDKLDLSPSSRVLVPLCGKSLDMIWLAQQGYEVIGIELSEIAVQEFFAEQGITPTIHQLADNPAMKYYQAELAGQTIGLWVADIFALTADDIGHIDAVYDRAALIAMANDMRPNYSQQIRRISDNAAQFIITLSYDQNKKDGPPFSVDDKQVQQYYSDHYQVYELASGPTSIGSAPDLTVTQQVWLLAPSDSHCERQ